MTILSYCLNVHPAETLDELVALLDGPVARVRAAWRGDGRMGAGLWLPLLAAQAIAEDDGAASRVVAALERNGLFAYSVNAFPIGGFHEARVKEAVYRPTWFDQARVEYTRLACRALARLLPPGARGSVSTLPISWAAFGESDPDTAGAHLGDVVADLFAIEAATGHEVALALEPEPGCLLERMTDAITFLEQHVFSGAGRAALAARAGLARSGAEAALRRFLGVCVDTCHLSVVFEPLPMALNALDEAGVRVVKAQLSAAPDLPGPARSEVGRRRLAAFDEPRYLHQTYGKGPGSVVTSTHDLGLALGPDGALAPGFAAVEQLRTHFHVPLSWPGDETLGTTRPELESALEQLARATDHLEVETYTFAVLPPEQRARYGDDVVAMVVEELRWAEAALVARGFEPA